EPRESVLLSAPGSRRRASVPPGADGRLRRRGRVRAPWTRGNQRREMRDTCVVKCHAPSPSRGHPVGTPVESADSPYSLHGTINLREGAGPWSYEAKGSW